MIDDYAYQERVAIMMYDGMIEEGIARIIAKIDSLQRAMQANNVSESFKRKCQRDIDVLKKRYKTEKQNLYQCSLFE